MSDLVSCILPTYNRHEFVARAIAYFLRQDYGARELIVVDDGTDAVGDLAAGDSRIRYIRLDRRHTVGAKRNLACREARGEIIVHWDDDDWAADWRLSYQVRRLTESGAEICGLDRLDYYEPATGQAWEYAYPPGARRWVAGNTLCYRKSFWERHPFPDINVGEDARFVWQAPPDQVLSLEDKRFLIATVHSGNVSPKATTGNCWRSTDAAPLLERMSGATGPRALIAAARGIGDILRLTPLARVLKAQGYRVDLLIRPDYAETVDLLRGAPDLCDVWTALPKDRTYDVAAFSFWAADLAKSVAADRKLTFDRGEWLRNGDSFCVEKTARALGWRDPMPAPFAVASDRKFDLPAGTVAIHTGCKPDWPWKKWHGFDELAALLPEVAVIGTPADLDNRGTYFAREFQWPAHVQDYVGKLSLRDTAALLRQCAALVSNDSGMMHLGAALGIPTVGVFGITSPAREGVPAKNLFPVTKGLACEPACRAAPWGRRDCEHHLKCLKELSARDVKNRLDEALGGRNMEKVAVTYYGHVHDASGYGNAARAYVHALDAAGVDVSVVDLSRHEPQVRDELIDRLAGRKIQADFHLFHGIPHVWAQYAFRVPNAIAMTVWETDTMPTQWRNTLNHTLETWLPCDFNVEVFQPQLRRPVAKIPHPVMPRNGNSNGPQPALFDLDAATFAVYSIFEWQDRKAPFEQLLSFLRAFSAADDAALIVKTNPAAAASAAEALDAARRQTGSGARVILCADAWTEEQIARLHRRGDCYLSLHRGEGWCYPLFEAACAGTPVVATAYAGPLEYLDPEHHQLVGYGLAPVRQTYAYYHPRMKWAQPDLDDAAARLRWVYEHRDEARESAAQAAERLRRQFSLEAVGKLAKARLLNLLQTTNRTRWSALRVAEPTVRPPAAGPIPGEWFDADYFEHGIKSNWRQGYHWREFAGLFQETALFLKSMFPAARSYFDAGAAKGFLIRALREAGFDASGCDVSAWAVAHAEPAAKPHLECAAAESLGWSREYDILTAWHLLPHMTEEQAMNFLQRARPHVKTALVAAISVFETAEERARDSGDAAHITRQSRAWWHERFLAAGWRQDPLHRAVQDLCQKHPLPARMGWELFVYSPGH